MASLVMATLPVIVPAMNLRSEKERLATIPVRPTLLMTFCLVKSFFIEQDIMLPGSNRQGLFEKLYYSNISS